MPSWFDKAAQALWGPDPTADAKTTARLLELNQAAAARGAISPAEAARRAALITETPTGIMSPSEGFAQGWEEGAASIRKAVGETINTTAGTVWKMIPWQLWAILGVALAIYLAPILLPRLARALR